MVRYLARLSLALALLVAGLGVPAGSAPRPRCLGEPATMVGTRKADVLRGTSGPDVIVARGGSDLILALGGADLVCGGGGADRIHGGRGADVLAGHSGNDALFGERGRDRLLGGGGTNGCLHGPGRGTQRNCRIRVAAAGDIACDPESSSFNGGEGTSDSCRMKATSHLLIGAGLVAVLALGDTQYEDGALAKYLASYDPTWGRVKDLTWPTPGNHEYLADGAAGYFSYFGARAGHPARGYYSFDLDRWHVVVLNSTCGDAGGCDAGSPQEEWLRQDLAASTARCTLAMWHEPRWSSGTHGHDDDVAAFWDALYEGGADVVLNGHEHLYERFAAQDPSGSADPTRGLRQFTVGTGGKNLTGLGSGGPNSEAQNDHTFGVLELVLRGQGYDWRFVPVAGGDYADTGSGSCH